MAEEINKVIVNMKKNREQSKNHNSYWMNAISNYYIEGVDITDPKNFDDIVNKLSPKDIQHFAKNYLRGRMWLIWYLNRSSNFPRHFY